jgi:transcriptional regulator with XRE-family HTH domain
MVINGDRARMARAAVKMSVREVAELAKVSPSTITRLEAGLDVRNSTMEAIRRAFEAVGVEFTNGDRPGVSLKR